MPELRLSNRFLSFSITGISYTEEREALAVLRCLQEVRRLVRGSQYPVKLHTDHLALLKVLESDHGYGRIAR